jgi:hypothetical protein
MVELEKAESVLRSCSDYGRHESILNETSCLSNIRRGRVIIEIKSLPQPAYYNNDANMKGQEVNSLRVQCGNFVDCSNICDKNLR